MLCLEMEHDPLHSSLMFACAMPYKHVYIFTLLSAAEIGDSPCSPQLSPVTGLEQELQVAVDPVTMETEEVVYKGEDPFKSEGTVQFLIKDTTKLFSKSGLNSLSDPVYIRDLPW